MTQQKKLSREERREKVLNAARDVFEADGDLGGGLRRIAASAGYTTGAIYKMFSGKDDIFAALLERSLKEMGLVMAVASSKEADPAAALRAAAIAVFLYYQEHQFEYRLGLYMFDTHGPKGLGMERDSALNEVLEDSLRVLEVGFQRLDAEFGDDESARNRAHALFASIAGVLGMHFSARDKSLKTSSSKILDTILDSLLEPKRGNTVTKI